MNGPPVAFHRASWALRVFLAVAFGGSGVAMLVAIPFMVVLFEQIGIGQWFRVATGVLEIACAVLLLISATARMAAALLLLIMIAAVATHWFVIGGIGAPAILLGALCVWLVILLGRPGLKSPAVPRNRKSIA